MRIKIKKITKLPINGKTKWIVILSCMLVLCLGVTIGTLWARRSQDPILSPDYAPPGVDENSEKIPGDKGDKLDTEIGGGAVGVQYSEQVTIDLSENMAYLQYANPGKSTQNILIQIVIKGKIVAQSGVIEPGYRLSKLKLLSGANEILQEGVYVDAVFKFLCYDPVTAEKAMVDTEGNITVTVQK